MADNYEFFRETAREMLREARESLGDLPQGLPDKAETPGQVALETKHGTPKAFAEACIQAVGEISPAEARAAVERYVKEWTAENNHPECRRCSVCEGEEHHWLPDYDDDGEDESGPFLVCKHCPARMPVPDDWDDY